MPLTRSLSHCVLASLLLLLLLQACLACDFCHAKRSLSSAQPPLCRMACGSISRAALRLPAASPLPTSCARTNSLHHRAAIDRRLQR